MPEQNSPENPEKSNRSGVLRCDRCYELLAVGHECRRCSNPVRYVKHRGRYADADRTVLRCDCSAVSIPAAWGELVS